MSFRHALFAGLLTLQAGAAHAASFDHGYGKISEQRGCRRLLHDHPLQTDDICKFSQSGNLAANQRIRGLVSDLESWSSEEPSEDYLRDQRNPPPHKGPHRYSQEDRKVFRRSPF
jgi:hypothetical protein